MGEAALVHVVDALSAQRTGEVDWSGLMLPLSQVADQVPRDFLLSKVRS